MAGHSSQTQSKNQLSLKFDGVLYFGLSGRSEGTQEARDARRDPRRGDEAVRRSGLRRDDDRPDRRGGRTCRARRCSATSRPRRRSSSAKAAPRSSGSPPACASAPAGETTIAVVRAWLDELTGWFEPELVLQQRLVREVPLVGARRLQLFGDAERAIADSLEAELGPGQELAARLAAAALVAGLRVAEETAAARMEQEDRALTERRGVRAPRRRRRLRRGRHRRDQRPVAAMDPALAAAIEAHIAEHYGPEFDRPTDERPALTAITVGMSERPMVSGDRELSSELVIVMPPEWAFDEPAYWWPLLALDQIAHFPHEYGTRRLVPLPGRDAVQGQGGRRAPLGPPRRRRGLRSGRPGNGRASSPDVAVFSGAAGRNDGPNGYGAAVKSSVRVG